jgi:hypothetical protein
MTAKKEVTIDQEIEWLEEEVRQDEFVMQSADRSSFHAERIAENKATLQELLEIKKARGR